MKISIITDEISADPETAIELGVQWGVHDFELRGYYGDRAPRLSDYQKRRLRDVLDRYGARIIAISPGLFKFPLPNKQPDEFPLPWLDKVFYEDWSNAKKQLDDHLTELLPESLELAHQLGAQKVVSFAFSRGGLPAGPPPDELFEYLFQAAERAKSAGQQIVIETEAGFWADTGERTGRIVQRINHPNLAINWDPGNSFCEGDIPYPDGYECIRQWVRHVHFKDARRMAGGCEFAREGEIDWTGQIRALAADGYDGYISVETHLRPKVAEAKAALDRLRGLIEAVEK